MINVLVALAILWYAVGLMCTIVVWHADLQRPGKFHFWRTVLYFILIPFFGFVMLWLMTEEDK